MAGIGHKKDAKSENRLTCKMERLFGRYLDESDEIIKKLEEANDLICKLTKSQGELIELYEKQLRTFDEIFHESTGWVVDISRAKN